MLHTVIMWWYWTSTVASQGLKQGPQDRLAHLLPRLQLLVIVFRIVHKTPFWQSRQVFHNCGKHSVNLTSEWEQFLAFNTCSAEAWKFSSVSQLCPTLCDPMDCSMPGFPVHHQFPELTQTHVHQVDNAIQLSHPLSPSPPAFNLPQHQGIFQGVSSLHQVAKVLKLQLQHQSLQWMFMIDFLQDWVVWSPWSPRDSQESSPRPQFKSTNSSVLSFLYLYGPTLTSIHDYWKNHNFD